MKKISSILFAGTFFLNGYAQIPNGYYDRAIGKTCAELKSALKYIITESHTPLPDDFLLDQYALTDVKPREVGTGSATVIWDVYADDPNGLDPYNYDPSTQNCGNYNSEADCYNKEHTVPRSWSDDDPIPEGDYHHVVPSDGWVNSKRSNYPFALVRMPAEFTSLNGSKLGNSATEGITGKVFEPIDEFKGDMARCFLYFITRYQDEVKSKWANNTQVFSADSFPTINLNYLPLMLAWHAADPVSDKELIRNEGGYTYQGNRNPFIDHPEYVDAVWNGGCPGLGVLPLTLLQFTGYLNKSTIQLNWSVANVLGIKSFEVQQSLNGKDFRSIAEVMYDGKNNYAYTTTATNGVSYYRIAWKSTNGLYSYSSNLSFTYEAIKEWKIFPNPVISSARIEAPSSVNGAIPISIYDIHGMEVFSDTQQAVNGIITLKGLNILPGLYYIKCRYQGSGILLKMIVID